MRSKVLVVFWGAAAASVLFLGAAWGTFGRLPAGKVIDAVVFATAAFGFAAMGFVAGRIVVVSARGQRVARRETRDGSI